MLQGRKIGILPCIQKFLAKNLNKLFVSEVFIKNVIFSMLLTHVFIKQIFRAVELASPFLTGLCRGWGSSGSFQPQAVALVIAMNQ
jgi:hypothetical protein